ncbi:MAG: MFS transporter [Proteobacteria bacterium]|nr:MFS transporter [Pseudomonadota bacterium]
MVEKNKNIPLSPSPSPSSMSASAYHDFILKAKALWKEEGPIWGIIMCGALFYAYQFILRVSPNVMNNEIMEAFMIDALAFGGVVSWYSWGYAGMQLPLGITLDRLGPRYLLATAACLCGLSCFLFAHANGLFMAGVARFAIGVGGACGLIGTLKLGTLWLHPTRLGNVIALTIGFGTLGACAGGAPLSMLVDAIGWRVSYMLLGGLGVGVGMLCYAFVRSPDEAHSHKDEAKPFLENRHPFHDIKTLALNPQTWIIALYGTLMYMPITIIGDAWGVPFVQHAAGVSEKEAAAVISAMFVGAAVGSPFFTTMSDMMTQRRFPMYVGSVASALVYIGILLYPAQHIYVFYGLFFLAGFFYTAKVLTFAVICEIMPRSMSGVSTAFINMIVMLTGAFHPFIGFLIELTWDHQYKDGIPLYTAGDYRVGLSLLPLCLVISIGLLKFMQETHPKSGSTQKDQPSVDVDVL